MRLLERYRERQAERIALIHSMEANGEAPTTELGITGKTVVVTLVGGIVVVIIRLLGG